MEAGGEGATIHRGGVNGWVFQPRLLAAHSDGLADFPSSVSEGEDSI